MASSQLCRVCGVAHTGSHVFQYVKEDEMNENLKDPLSLEPLLDAVELPCEHVFSRDTIVPWLAQGHQCPLKCAGNVNESDLRPVGKVFRNLLDSLLVVCPFGCEAHVPRGELEIHLLHCARRQGAAAHYPVSAPISRRTSPFPEEAQRARTPPPRPAPPSATALQARAEHIPAARAPAMAADHHHGGLLTPSPPTPGTARVSPRPARPPPPALYVFPPPTAHPPPPAPPPPTPPRAPASAPTAAGGARQIPRPTAGDVRVNQVRREQRRPRDESGAIERLRARTMPAQPSPRTPTQPGAPTRIPAYFPRDGTSPARTLPRSPAHSQGRSRSSPRSEDSECVVS
eukprot:m.12164 g.12164  ORF g.12164 m.12164 type:complete len:344 (+) comp5962_c0_seq1:44-1075(+)